MPVYQVELKPSAVRQLAGLQPRDRRRVARKIGALARDPRPHGVEKLQGAVDLWRVRVGSFRVIYQIRDDIVLVLVVSIGDRRDVYRSRR